MGDPLRRDREEPNEVSATPSLCQKDRRKIQAGGPGSPVSLGRISVIFFFFMVVSGFHLIVEFEL